MVFRRSGAGQGSLRAKVAITLLGNTFPPLVALATAPLLAAGLGVVGRGELASATAPLLLAVSLATIGVPPAVNYFVARAPRLAAIAARRGAVIVGLAGVLAVLVTSLARDWLSAGDGALATQMMIASLAIAPTVIVSVVQAAAAGMHKWGFVAAERMTTAIVKLAGIAGLFATGNLTGTTAVLVIAFAPVLGGFVYVFMGLSRSDGGRVAETAGYGDLLAYGVRVWIGSVAGILLMRIDQVIFLPIGGAYELGLYVVAVTISEVPLIVNSAIREVLFTHDASRGDDAALTRASRVSTIISAGAAVAVGATAWSWVPWLFGDDFGAALPALLVLLVGVVLGNPGSIGGTGLAARGYPGRRSISLLVACVANLVLFVVLVPGMGAVGAAIATLVGNLLASNLNLWFLRRHCGIQVRSFYSFRWADLRVILSILRRSPNT